MLTSSRYKVGQGSYLCVRWPAQPPSGDHTAGLGLAEREQLCVCLRTSGAFELLLVFLGMLTDT